MSSKTDEKPELLTPKEISSKRRKMALSILTALVMPGGLVIVPLYHWLKKKKAQSRKP